MYKKTVAILGLASAALGLCCRTGVYALDTDPTTYNQAPDGSTVIHTYEQYRTSTNLKYSGSGVSYARAGSAANSRADTEAAYLQYSGYFDVGGVMVDPHIYVPYASLNHGKIGGSTLNGSTGWGDPLLAVVIAPIHAPDNSQILGLGLGTIVPLGQYEPGKTLNTGDNRWKGSVQIGGVQRIVSDWSFAGTADVTFYSDNSNAGTGAQLLKQERSYQLQPWIVYRPALGYSVALGYSQTFGGKQKLNGVENGWETNARQIRLDINAPPIGNTFLGLQVGRDMATEGGFRESLRITTRVSFLF